MHWFHQSASVCCRHIQTKSSNFSRTTFHKFWTCSNRQSWDREELRLFYVNLSSSNNHWRSGTCCRLVGTLPTTTTLVEPQVLQNMRPRRKSTCNSSGTMCFMSNTLAFRQWFTRLRIRSIALEGSVLTCRFELTLIEISAYLVADCYLLS